MIELKKVKKILENMIYLLFSKNEKTLYSKIDKYEYISFDIFDTLIKRVIKEPEYIFDLVEEKYNSISPNRISGFKKKRINAYIRALKEKESEDIDLENVYKFIDEFDDKEKDILKKIEIELEKKICIKNEKMLDIYKYCIKNDKKIFMTSDMYLPKEVIEYILKNNGYKNYNKLYISSNEGMTKKTGNLFRKIIDDNSIKPKMLLHIGDSPLQDYIVPKVNGIKSFLIKRNIKNESYCSKSDSEEYKKLRTFINNSMNNYNKLDNYCKFGYEVFGPLLFGFINWLNKKIIDDNIETVCFLARDAKVVMDAYQSIYSSKVTMKYLNISRKSIILSELDDIEKFDDLIFKLKSILKSTTTVEELLKIINFEPDVLGDNFVNKFKIITELTDEEKKYIFSKINDYMHEYSLKQKKIFNKYLNENEIKGKIAFVDIGWRGTIQYLVLKKYPRYDLTGYYFGINIDKKFTEYDVLNRKGYLFDNVKYSNYQSIISLSVGLFETMFLSTEGTTLRYEINEENKVIPVKDLPDCNENDIVYIEKIQNFAKEFVINVKKFGMLDFFNSFQKSTFFENYKNFTINPTIRKINLFKNFSFQGTKKSKLIENKNIIYYLLHPKIFIIDLNNSYCKIMFLKNVLKIYLPYYKILDFLYKKTKI